jgi:hypothetical protein
MKNQVVWYTTPCRWYYAVPLILRRAVELIFLDVSKDFNDLPFD